MTYAMRLLIVDDDNDYRAMMEKTLRGFGYRVVSVPSGPSAIAALRAQQFDTILCDLRMPEMSGPEAIAEFRLSNPKTVVIVVSGSADQDQVREAFRAGADGFVAKEELARILGDKKVIEDVIAGRSTFLKSVLERQVEERLNVLRARKNQADD